MPANVPSMEYFGSWAAILSQFYGHEDIFMSSRNVNAENLARSLVNSDLPIVVSFWVDTETRDSQDDEEDDRTATFRVPVGDGEVVVNASGYFYEDLPDYEPIVVEIPVNGEPVLLSSDDALESEESYYTMSYFYNAEREQIRFHLLFDPRTISFAEEPVGETIPARGVLTRVEEVIRKLVIAHAPSWANERGEIRGDLPMRFFLEPDRSEERIQEEERRREEERQEEERERLITNIASAFSHSRADECERMEQQLMNMLYDIDAHKRQLRDLEEKYAKTIKEIVGLRHSSIEELKESIRSYADSINLNNLKVSGTTISYVVEAFKLELHGQHDCPDVIIGPLNIRLDRHTLAVSVTALQDTKVSSRGLIHPHVNSDGLVCWGGTAPDSETPSGREMVSRIMKRRNIFELLFYAVDFFKNGYNSDDAYGQAPQWLPDAERDDDEYGWYCDHCEEYHPNGEECPAICADCGDYVDWEIHRNCPRHGCYDMEGPTSSSRDPNLYEEMHYEHCPECIEDREEEERLEAEREEREQLEAERLEAEREAREEAIEAAEQSSEVEVADSDSGGSITITPGEIRGDEQGQGEQEQEQGQGQEEREEQELESEDVPF